MNIWREYLVRYNEAEDITLQIMTPIAAYRIIMGITNVAEENPFAYIF